MPQRFLSFIKWSTASLAVLFLIIQFIPVDRTNPPVQTTIQAPEDITTILRRACFDCHSHETVWPWYSRVAPASWLLASHVQEGRKDLNFSIWPAFNFQGQELIFREMEKQIKEEKMPPAGYVFSHPDAQLNDKDKSLLLSWIRAGFNEDANFIW